jgi:uncharacterized protein (DUF4415 family)
MSAKITTQARRGTAARDRTDWERVRNMTEEEIEAAAASDPDNPPLEEGFMREGRTVRPDSARWEVIHLHIDVDILDWFRSRRFLYQDEINEALRNYMKAHGNED